MTTFILCHGLTPVSNLMKVFEKRQRVAIAGHAGDIEGYIQSIAYSGGSGKTFDLTIATGEGEKRIYFCCYDEGFEKILAVSQESDDLMKHPMPQTVKEAMDRNYQMLTAEDAADLPVQTNYGHEVLVATNAHAYPFGEAKLYRGKIVGRTTAIRLRGGIRQACIKCLIESHADDPRVVAVASRNQIKRGKHKSRDQVFLIPGYRLHNHGDGLPS